MKKILSVLILLNFMMVPSYAFNIGKFEIKKPQFKKVEFKKPEFKKSPEREVLALLKEHNKAMERHDIAKAKSFYSSDYKSSDGFDLEELASMLDKTFKSYSNLKYKTKINKVVVFDDYAIAEVSDVTTALIYPDEKKQNKEKAGYLTGKSAYNVYFRKKDGAWKIFFDDILMEETNLKYGVANEIKMELQAPLFVEGGHEYDLALKMDKPQDIIALGAISNEEIIYPPSDYQEKFRRIPAEGELERIVKANKKNLDEYAVASVGFTRVSVNEEVTKAKIEIIGMAYMMKRVNMLPDKILEKKLEDTIKLEEAGQEENKNENEKQL